MSGNRDFPHLENDVKKIVDDAQLRKYSVITTLEGFETKHELLILRDFLRYASAMGVQVVFEPFVKIKEL